MTKPTQTELYMWERGSKFRVERDGGDIYARTKSHALEFMIAWDIQDVPVVALGKRECKIVPDEDLFNTIYRMGMWNRVRSAPMPGWIYKKLEMAHEAALARARNRRESEHLKPDLSATP